ncbi:MAG TPA: hypothetical protein VF230_05155 [Acidimicrobiales bacterium]
MRPFQRAIDFTAGPIVGAGLGALSFVRRARVFHPTGAAFQATVDVQGDRVPDGLAPHGRHRAVVRLSRGAGTPEPMPDILGVAVRILDAHGAGGHQDLLLASSGAPPVLRHALLPAIAFGTSFFSSLLPYRTGDGRVVVLGARPLWTGTQAGEQQGSTEPLAPTATLADVEAALESAKLRLELVVAEPARPWQPFATIDVGRRLGDAEAESLRFNPFNTGDAFEPAGVLNAVRRRAYAASQAARPTPLADPAAPHHAA